MADIDQDRPCPHPEFTVFADVGRVVQEGEPECADVPAIAFKTSIRVECSRCDEKFRWVGLKAGDLPGKPMCSVDEYELRAPIRPGSSDPDFGLGIPGYAINYRSGP